MSLYGALLSGVTGLRAQTQSLATISDNISNVNTVAYKKSAMQFSTLVTGTSTGTEYAPGGVKSAPQALIDKQGLLQASSRPTDIGITGAGFFAVNTEPSGQGEALYTRAGAFSEDNAGRLRNAAGYYLQGWALNQQGAVIDINTIQTVSVGTLNGVAVNTTRVDIGANLDAQQAASATSVATFTANSTPAQGLADGTTTPHFRRAIKVFDSLGTGHNLNLSFMRLSNANSWGFAISAATPGEVTLPAGFASAASGLLAFGTLAFNGDGSLNATSIYTASGFTSPATFVADPAPPAAGSGVEITWTNGASASNIKANWGTAGAPGVGKTDGITQFASSFNVAFINQDGAEVGLRTGVSIDRNGFVIASFSNGATQKIYQIPVVTFSNPSALSARNGNTYAETDASGEFNLRIANTGGSGRIEASSLEGSNIDLGEEFTQMIITQRAYSASAKSIATADEMLEELLRIKR
ncbi:MAG: flagellar hook protein FlgE [Pseudomonadota bacterium]